MDADMKIISHAIHASIFLSVVLSNISYAEEQRKIKFLYIDHQSKMGSCLLNFTLAKESGGALGDLSISLQFSDKDGKHLHQQTLNVAQFGGGHQQEDQTASLPMPCKITGKAASINVTHVGEKRSVGDKIQPAPVFIPAKYKLSDSLLSSRHLDARIYPSSQLRNKVIGKLNGKIAERLEAKNTPPADQAELAQPSPASQGTQGRQEYRDVRQETRQEHRENKQEIRALNQ